MFRKSIFTLAFLAVIGWVSAQSLQFEMDGRVFANNEVYICEDSPNWGEIELKMQLRNLTDRQLSVIVEKDPVKVVDGTTNYFCWGSCLGPDAISTRPVLMEPNAVSGNGDLPQKERACPCHDFFLSQRRPGHDLFYQGLFSPRSFYRL